MDRNEITLIEAIENDYLPHIKASYVSWIGGSKISEPNNQQLIDSFAAGLSYKKGRNYVKITAGLGSNRSVHSFVVIKPTKGYEIGDILKAASWCAPATNFKRGNVFCPALFAAVTWTGA